MSYCIAIFNTTYETLRAEDFFREANVVFKPILKPRKIGSACRMALRFDEKDIRLAEEAIKNGDLELLSFYRQNGDLWDKM